jgi:hypothetical protein
MRKIDNNVYERSVFINCPFDDQYAPILHAITFAIIFAGYIPRSALERKDSGEERLDKIFKIIEECKYSLHDISRADSVPSDPNLPPRFNMPFECGIYYGARYFGNKTQKAKQLLILDSQPYRFQKTMSDIAGKDPDCHNNSSVEAIACVRRFLGHKSIVGEMPGEKHFQEQFAEFQRALPSILVPLKLTIMEISKFSYWKDYVNIVDQWTKRKKSIAPSI